MSHRPTLVVLTGPTAVGKTELSLSLAEALQCPIISADSRQIYSEMTIGTAAPTAEQLARVRHYLVGCCSVADYYSAYEFERDCLDLLPTIFAQTDGVALMTGGSMMYIDALCDGIDEIPTISDNVRHDVWQHYQNDGLDAMRQWLRQLDPAYYEQVDLCNGKRVVHAIEICLEAGRPYSELRTGRTKPRDFDIVRIALNRPREELFVRIGRRVDEMIAQGLEDEARRLYPMRHLNALNTVGYKELFSFFDGALTRLRAIEDIKTHTRRYAKRQLTWFTRRGDYRWFAADDAAAVTDYALRAVRR